MEEDSVIQKMSKEWRSKHLKKRSSFGSMCYISRLFMLFIYILYISYKIIKKNVYSIHLLLYPDHVSKYSTLERIEEEKIFKNIKTLQGDASAHPLLSVSVSSFILRFVSFHVTQERWECQPRPGKKDFRMFEENCLIYTDMKQWRYLKKKKAFLFHHNKSWYYPDY